MGGCNRTPEERRHGLEGEHRALQRRQAFQDLRPRRARRHRLDHRRQLLRLLEEGSQNANIVLGESSRTRRGRARRRSAGLSLFQPRHALRARYQPAEQGAQSRRRARAHEGPGRGQGRGLCRRQGLPEHRLSARRRRDFAGGPDCPMDMGGGAAEPPNTAERNIRPSYGLSRTHGAARRLGSVAPRRYGGRRALVPQTLHCLGRRQVRNRQADNRCSLVLSSHHRRLRFGHGGRGSNHRTRLLRPL